MSEAGEEICGRRGDEDGIGIALEKDAQLSVKQAHVAFCGADVQICGG